MGFNWTTSQFTMDVLFGTRASSFWSGGQSSSSMFGQQNAAPKEAPVPTSTASYFTKPTPQPPYTVTPLGSANPYSDQMPMDILMARQKYGYNEPGVVPFVGPTSVDIFRGNEKVRTEKMTTEQAAMVYAPVQPGKTDQFTEDRAYFAGKKLEPSLDTKGRAVDKLPPTYQSQWDAKNKAGTWWGR